MIPAGVGLRRRLAGVLAATSRRVVALLYHRIAAVDCDPWELAVSPDHFRSHLEVLERRFRPLSVDEVAAALESGEVPRRAVTVCFDDGYLDNLEQAKPLLEEHAVPGVIFVVTGGLDAHDEFWWDELERIFLQPGRLPSELCIDLGSSARGWRLDGAADYGRDEFERFRRWRARDAPPTPRHAIFLDLCELLKTSPRDRRVSVIEQLRRWSGSPAAARASHRPLTRDDVRQLATGVVTIGAHTVTHAQLAALPAGVQRSEAAGSKSRLEQELGRPIRHFAYPFGGPDDYSASTLEAVREAGFATAWCNRSGAVSRTSDPLQLPRLFVPDIDGETFAARLTSQFGADG